MPDPAPDNYCILLDTFEPVDNRALAKIVGGLTDTAPFDIIQKLAKNSGFILENCTLDIAQKIAQSLNAAGIKARPVQHSALYQLPSPSEIAKVEFNESGILCTLRGSVEQNPAQFKNLQLISAVILKEEIRSTHVEIKKPSAASQAAHLGLMAAGIPVGFAKEKKVNVETKETELHFYLDLFFADPFMRFRINPVTFNFDCLGPGMTYSSTVNYRILLKKIAELCPQSRKNQGAQFLLAGKALTLLPNDNEPALEKEAQWILTIAS